MSQDEKRSYREDNWQFDPGTDIPICNYCQHYQDGLNCAAFPAPQIIPDAILNHKDPHEKVWPGQTGDFVFQKK